MERIQGDSLRALVAASSRHHFYFKSQFEHTLGNVETGFCLCKVTQEDHRDPKSRQKQKPGVDGDSGADVKRYLTS